MKEQTRNTEVHINEEETGKLPEKEFREDGGGIGWGDHFLFYKFIERTTER